MQMNEYSTLPKLKKYLSLSHSDADDDEQLRGFLESSSRAIDRFTNRTFYPQRKVRYYDSPENARVLRVDNDFVEVIGLSHLNGASEMDNSVYWPKSGEGYDDTPYDRIELSTHSGSIFNYSGTPQRAILLEAIWTYHDDYDNAWQDANVVSFSAISVDATSIVLSGPSSGSDIYGGPSRIQEQHLLRIGSEYVYVTSGSGDNGINVRRGVNGTTAASHGSGTPIAVWNPVPDIEYCARELAAFQYAHSTNPQSGRVTTFVGAGFTIDEPGSFPPSVKDKLRRLKKRKVYSF